MVYAVLTIVLVVIALAFHYRRWRCPACDVSSYDEAEAQKHAEEHARHRPMYK